MVVSYPVVGSDIPPKGGVSVDIRIGVTVTLSSVDPSEEDVGFHCVAREKPKMPGYWAYCTGNPE